MFALPYDLEPKTKAHPEMSRYSHRAAELARMARNGQRLHTWVEDQLPIHCELDSFTMATIPESPDTVSIYLTVISTGETSGLWALGAIGEVESIVHRHIVHQIDKIFHPKSG